MHTSTEMWEKLTLAWVVRADLLEAFTPARARFANVADPWKLLERAGAVTWPRKAGRKLCTCTDQLLRKSRSMETAD